ncbi:MAG: excinuclease ABC subunit UvrB [Candidatus Acidulodesulfobacterium acidiphilum]|uniref:UvrABC system protein B n=1 Tax=Candidatus Acidulodesulfobacterium acidiphilum TaxID=2597224 RepID=A0A520XFT4_9DELT|nr:MAG: excinuclease ABC subunit UvrB [Candidatus Acidulodesulfobacterium acidiphilum]
MDLFNLVSENTPAGDQPVAIKALTDGIEKKNFRYQTLLGVTGSGKTFTMANIIKELQRPALIIAPNKTLAGQLYSEFKSLFPENAVEFFISYYDYYQPEAYVPSKDLYIEKDSAINDQIDKMKHSATRSILSRRDVIVIASVSCIYGLGSPESYANMLIEVKKGDEINLSDVLDKLTDIRYERNDIDFHRGTFRVRGDIVDVFPAYEEEVAIRIEFFGNEVSTIAEIDPLRGVIIRRLSKVAIYPASHYVADEVTMKSAVKTIKEELKERLMELKALGKLVEAQRLEQRTMYDLEMMQEMGYCSGIENYSRHLTGRKKGEPPPTLLDYFPEDFIIMIDESHVSVPQIKGMYNGDISRKSTLVEYGFRLPCALDNRPLNFEEFSSHIKNLIFVSATPADYELSVSSQVVEQIIRPTGLIDPEVEVRPETNQVDDIIGEIKKTVAGGGRALVTTLTKRMSEDLSEFLIDSGIKAKYLHSDIDSLERFKIIRELRLGEFDVLVGINLLREGLDIPEVELIGILDADKEGFLRSKTSLIQTIGRAARNIKGKVILYGNNITDSMKFAISETERRRKIQETFNKENNITPTTVKKNIAGLLTTIFEQDYIDLSDGFDENSPLIIDPKEAEKLIKNLTKKMKKAVKELNFEEAAHIRDEIRNIKKNMLLMDKV